MPASIMFRGTGSLIALDSPSMPRALAKTTGDPDELVEFQIKVPRWMKNGAIDTAQDKGKSLADWTRDLLRAALEEERPRRRNG
jgi:hypothetical protein